MFFTIYQTINILDNGLLWKNMNHMKTQLILRQTRLGDVVIDVGANIGYYTILLADKVGKDRKSLCL